MHIWQRGAAVFVRVRRCQCLCVSVCVELLHASGPMWLCIYMYVYSVCVRGSVSVRVCVGV